VRASTPLATTKQASSENVRTKICAPIAISDRDQRTDERPARAPAGRPRAQQHGRERRAHPQLRRDRSRRRAVEAEAEAVDEQELQHHVRGVRRDDDHQRRAQVRLAA
jgi:hypothetical protein